LNLTGAGTAGEGAPVSPVAVAMNATGDAGTGNTFLTVYPADSTKPTASDVNVPPATDFGVLVIVKLSMAAPAGDFDIYNNAGSIDVILDVQGWFK
jgi:hypothetical protein